jgi:cytochrome b561
LLVSGILVLLVVATVILAPGAPKGPQLLASLVQTLVTIGIVLLVIRLVRVAFRRDDDTARRRTAPTVMAGAAASIGPAASSRAPLGHHFDGDDGRLWQ